MWGAARGARSVALADAPVWLGEIAGSGGMVPRRRAGSLEAESLDGGRAWALVLTLAGCGLVAGARARRGRVGRVVGYARGRGPGAGRWAAAGA